MLKFQNNLIQLAAPADPISQSSSWNCPFEPFPAGQPKVTAAYCIADLRNNIPIKL